MENWVEDENKPGVFCPLTEDFQVVTGLSYIGIKPPGKLIGTFSATETGVIRITIGEKAYDPRRD